VAPVPKFPDRPGTENRVHFSYASLTQGLAIRGSVRVEGDPQPNLTDVRISLLPFGAGEVLTSLPNSQVKEDGSFTLSNVRPDQYNLFAFELPDGYYVKSIRMGDEDVLDAGLNLSDGAGAPISIVLSPGAAQIEGIVQNGKRQGATGALVVLIPRDDKRRDQMQHYRTTTSDQYDRFVLRNVHPGAYKLFAWEDLEYDAFIDPDFVRPVENQGAPLTISENNRSRIQLRLIEADGSQQK